MARRILDDERNRVRKRNNAASSITNTVATAARQARAARKPVQKRTMDIAGAGTKSAVKQRPQVSRKPSQPRQRNYNQNTWSPVTDPVTEYFSPAPPKPKKTLTPEQQRRREITLNAIDQVEPTAHISYEDDITLRNLGASLDKGLVGGVQNAAINAPAAVARASEARWRDYTPNEDNNFVELSPEMRAEMARRAGATAQGLENSALNQSLEMRKNELSNPLDGTFVGGVMESTGNMLPSMAASYLTGGLGAVDAAGAANMATMLTGAFGGSAKQAIDQGIDPRQAVAYGLANAAIEGLTENMNHYVPGTFGQLPGVEDLIGEGEEEFVGRLAEPFSNLLLQEDQSLSGLGNGLKDVWSQNFAPWNGTESPLLNTLAEAGQEGLAGIASAAMLGGAQFAANASMEANDPYSPSNYMRYINDLQEHAKVLESAGTEDAKAEAAIYRQMADEALDGIIRPEYLLSSNEAVRSAAQRANTERIMASAERFGVESGLAQNMARICNKVGISMSFDDKMDAKVNGKYENGHITISTKAADPIATVFSHELTHALQGSEAYGDYRAALYGLANSGILGGEHGTVAELQDLIKQPQNYGDVDQATLDNETTAILTQDLIGNAYAIDQLVSSNRGLAVRLYEGIKSTLSKFGATAEERAAIDNKRSLQKAEDLFRRAIENPGPIYDPATNSLQFSVKITKPMLKWYAPNALDKNGNVRPVADQLRDLYEMENPFGYAAIPVGDSLKFMGIDSEYLLMSYEGLNHSLRHTSLPELQEMFTNFGDRVLMGNDFQDKKTAWISFPSARYGGKNMPFAVALAQDTPSTIRVQLDPRLRFDALDVAMDAYDKHSFSREYDIIMNDPATKKYFGPNWGKLKSEFYDANEAQRPRQDLIDESRKYEKKYNKPLDPITGENAGYHYGSPDFDYQKKSEKLWQRPGRGTGAFGTGTYFFGWGRNSADGQGFQKGLTEHKVDFSNYKLFRPRTADDGRAIHRYFKLLDDTFGAESLASTADRERVINDVKSGINEFAANVPANENNERIVDRETVEGLLEGLRGIEDDDVIENIIDQATWDEGVDIDYIPDNIDEYTEDTRRASLAERVSRIKTDSRDIAKRLRVSQAKLDKIVDAAIQSARSDMEAPDYIRGMYDSVGTRVMKALGYEGIDVRGIRGLDTSEIGSVIYDIKPETVQYSRKLTKPAPGQMQLDLEDRPAGTDLSNGPQIINEEEGETVDLRNDPLREMARDEAARTRMNRLLDEESVVNEDEGETVDLKNDPLRNMLRDQADREITDRFIDKGPTVIDENAPESEIDRPGESWLNQYEQARQQTDRLLNGAPVIEEDTDSDEEFIELKNDDFRKSVADAIDRETPDLDDGVKEAFIDEAEAALDARRRANSPVGDTRTNKTMRNISQGKGSGLYDNVSEDTQNIVQDQIYAREDDVRYERTHRDDLNASFEERRKADGDFDSFFDRVMNRQAMMDSNDPFGAFKKTASKMWYGNALAGDVYNHIIDLQGLQSEIETRKQSLIDEAKKHGFDIDEIVSLDGEYRARAMADGKMDTSELARSFTDRIDDLNDKLGKVRKEYAGVGHTAGTVLNLFRTNFEAMSPRQQLDEIQKAIDEVNDEMFRKFKKRFETGEYRKLELDKEFRDNYLKADNTQEARNELAKEFMRQAAQQFPHTKGEMLRSWRYMMMLTNPTTWIRNALGNYGMQGMTSLSNGTKFLLEKTLQDFGFVSNYADFNTAENRHALKAAREMVDSTLIGSVSQLSNISDKEVRRAKLRELGLSGKLLKDMTNYKGKTYDTNVHAATLDKVARQLATSMLNDKFDYTDPSKTNERERLQMVNKAYNESAKHLMDRADMRHTTAEGRFAKADTAVYKDLFADRWSDVAQMNSKTDNDVSETGLKAVFNQERAKTPFNDNNFAERLANRVSNFTGKMMNEAEIGGLIKLGDQPFTRDRFATAMSQYMTAQGYSTVKNEDGSYTVKKGDTELSEYEANKVLDQFGEEAMLEALESVYRDVNWAADMINKVRREHPGWAIPLDAILPFTRTPFNIGRRAIEYSPAGLIKSLIQLNAVKNGRMSGTAWVSNMAKGMTGSAATALGILLAKLGLISGTRSNEDDKEKKFKASIGENNYALTTPWGSYTVDWAAPTVSAVLLGAQMYDIAESVPHKNGENPLMHMTSVLMEEGKSGWDIVQPILDTTYMQGLMDSINSFTDKNTNPFLSVLESYAGQLTPTLGAKIRKTWDDTARSTYSDKWPDRVLRQARNKSLMVDAGAMLIDRAMTGEWHGLEPQLDNKGNEIKNVGGNIAGRLAYNMLSPGIWRPNTADDYDKELLRLYNSDSVTKDKNYLLPEQLYAFKMSGEQYKFTPQERTELNKYYLQGLRGGIQEYMNSGLYGRQTDQERASMINDLQSYYMDKTRERYFRRVAPDKAKDIMSTQNVMIDKLGTVGMTPYQVLNNAQIKSDKDEHGETIRNSRAMNVRENLEALGVYDDVLRMIERGEIEPGDVGLSKTVIGWGDDAFSYYMDLKNDGLYNPGSRKSSGRSGSSRRRSSGGSSRSSSSDIDKMYQKLYNMAMSNTLGSIGKLSTSMNKAAGTSAKDRVDDGETNHSRLIKELERMIAAQK